jgi:hypothetical protein
MNIIQYLLLLIFIFALWRVFLKKKRGDISLREWLAWSLFWLMGVIATILPKTTDILAEKLGLASGRGVDLVVYISIPVLFYVSFRLLSKIDRVEQNITKLVRDLAITQEKENKK